VHAMGHMCLIYLLNNIMAIPYITDKLYKEQWLSVYLPVRLCVVSFIYVRPPTYMAFKFRFQHFLFSRMVKSVQDHSDVVCSYMITLSVPMNMYIYFVKKITHEHRN
jgi:hypothetical protein